MDADDRLLTVREVADVMRVSQMTVYRLIKAGELAALRVGRNFRIRESDVDRYFEAQMVALAPAPSGAAPGPRAGGDDL